MSDVILKINNDLKLKIVQQDVVLKFFNSITVDGGSGIDTLESYTDLRTYAGTSLVVYVQDFTYTFNSVSYTTLGGLFRRVSTGAENGGTLIDGVFKWARDWDEIHVQPEWWQVGGYDANGVAYTDKNISSAGIYNEADRINSAIQVGGAGSVLVFYKGKTYEMDKNIDIQENQTFLGNGAILKRISTPTSLLTANSSSGAFTVTVASATGFRVGQTILITKTTATHGGIAYDENVGMLNPLRITNVAGNVITLSAALPENVIIGWRLIIKLSIISPNDGASLKLATIKQLNFDGNKTGNPYCIDWRYGASINLSSSEEQTLIDNCYFYESPSETIFSGSCKILNSSYSEINGSLIHFSSNINRASTTVIDKCFGVGSNRGTNALMYHSEALITSSANVTNVRITGCNFEDGDEAVFTTDSYDDFEIAVENNNFKDFKWSFFGGTGGGIGVEKFLKVNNNSFNNCGPIWFDSGTPSQVYDRTGWSHIVINNNTFINTRLQFNQGGILDIENNRFLWDASKVTKYDYSVNTLNGISAFNHIVHFDRVHILNNIFEYPPTYQSITQYGLLLQHANEVRKTSVGVDTEYLYAQDVKVNGNTFAGFKYAICTVPTTSPQNLNLIKQAVGWEYKNNIIYMARSTGAGNGTGIFVDPGVVCEGNTIYTNSAIPCYAGIIVAGVGTSGNAHNRLLGGICINNKVLGCSGATAADIVANADGVRYNVTAIGNMTRDDIFNAVNGYFSANYKLTTANYPQLSALACPAWQYWAENANQY